MLPFELFTPWIIFTVTLIALLYLSRWVHRHLYGVGWLLTKDNEKATILYYLILLPGVFVHEVGQWLVAGALNVSTKRSMAWPKAQKQGELRVDFVRIGKTDRLRAALIGATPLAIGTLLVLLIGNNILNIENLSIAFASGQWPILQEAINRLFATPDFWLWFYLLFAVGNAMMPNPADRQGWPLLGGIFGAIAIFLLILGLGETVILPALQGPIAQILNILVTAFTIILILDCFVGLALVVIEITLEQIKGEKVKYPQKPRTTAVKLQPGSDIALPADQAPMRIIERPLPLPGPPKRQRKKKEAKPSIDAPTPRPALSPPQTQSGSQFTGRPTYQPGSRQTTIDDPDELDTDVRFRRPTRQIYSPDETMLTNTLEREEIEPSEIEEDDNELRYEPFEDSV